MPQNSDSVLNLFYFSTARFFTPTPLRNINKYLVMDFDMYYFLSTSSSGGRMSSSSAIITTIFCMRWNLTDFGSSISCCVILVVWRFWSCVFQATETWKSHSKFTTKLLLQQDIGRLETCITYHLCFYKVYLTANLDTFFGDVLKKFSLSWIYGRNWQKTFLFPCRFTS